MRNRVWIACLAATICVWAALLAIVYRMRQGDLFLRPSPTLSYAVLGLSALLWVVTARNTSHLQGWKRRITVLALIVSAPAGLVVAIGIGFGTPTTVASIQEKGGGKVVLGIEPAWDVRAYALYDSLWGGLAWRQRRDDGAVFWDYSYRGEMKLGLDAEGRAVLLNPLGYPEPFPDGLSTIPCPPGSPPQCVMKRPRD